MDNLTNSDFIALAGILLTIIAIVISIYQVKKYTTSPPSEKEVVEIDKLIDRILKLNYSITYYTYLKKKGIRKAFSISGNHVSLEEKIERKIDKRAVNFPVIACEKYIDNDYFKEFSNNRFLSSALREKLGKFCFTYDSELYSEQDLIETKLDFALLDQNNPVSIFLAIGAIPMRRGAIRKGTYRYLKFENKIMTAENLKSVLNDIDKELKEWLSTVGKKHMYQKKKTSIVPNKLLNQLVEDFRNEIDKDLSIDLFSVKEGSKLAKELKMITKNVS